VSIDVGKKIKKRLRFTLSSHIIQGVIVSQARRGGRLASKGFDDITDYTDPKRDIIGELAAACQKHGLKLGLYYSHWVDWEHEFGWDHTK
jgi:hypothetical protein